MVTALKLSFKYDNKDEYWSRFLDAKNAVVSFLDAWGFGVKRGYLSENVEGNFNYYIYTNSHISDGVIDILKNQIKYVGVMEIEKVDVK